MTSFFPSDFQIITEISYHYLFPVKVNILQTDGRGSYFVIIT